MEHGQIKGRLKFTTATDYDIADWFDDYRHFVDVAYMEKVHSMPKQGNVSSFTFGERYGFLRGLMTGLRIRYEYVTPQKWQKTLGCLTHGDKNISKAAAQRLWPKLKWTHATADAALIAEYGRRKEGGTNGQVTDTSDETKPQ